MDSEKTYEEKYKTLLDDLVEHIDQGIVYSDGFPERVRKEKNELDGVESDIYPITNPDLIMT